MSEKDIVQKQSALINQQTQIMETQSKIMNKQSEFLNQQALIINQQTNIINEQSKVINTNNFIFTKYICHELIKRSKNIHFIGVSGVSMSAIASILQTRGFNVSGTDKIHRNLGFSTFLEDEKSHIPENTDIVVRNSVIDNKHPEIVDALEKKIPILHRVDVLEYVTSDRYKYSVTGGSGKTSTTLYLNSLLSLLKKDPFCIVGIREFEEKPYKEGQGPYVIEINEGDMFNLRQNFCQESNAFIFLNTNEDHYWDFDEKVDKAEEIKVMGYTATLSTAQIVCYNFDDKNCKKIVNSLHDKVEKISFGFEEGADYRISITKDEFYNMAFEVMHNNKTYSGKAKLPSKYNVLGVCAASALISKQYNIDLQSVLDLVPSVKQANKRMEILYQNDKVMVVLDQALHHEELKNSINVLKETKKPVSVVFSTLREARFKLFDKQFIDIAKQQRTATLDDYFTGLDLEVIKDAKDLSNFINKTEGICLISCGYNKESLIQEWKKGI